MLAVQISRRAASILVFQRSRHFLAGTDGESLFASNRKDNPTATVRHAGARYGLTESVLKA